MPLQQDTLQEHIKNTGEDRIIDNIYPKINLETEDILMTISVKKDYSDIEDIDERKEEFIKDLNSFIKEFSETNESRDFVSYLD